METIDMYTLVTGASGGIGAAVCEQLAAQGNHLFITGRNINDLVSVKAKIQKNSDVDVKALAANLSEVEDINDVFVQIAETLKVKNQALHGLVHCAGFLDEGLLMTAQHEKVSAALNLNLQSGILVTQKASRLMMRYKQGVITLISSVVAQQGSAGQAVYSAAKAGLIGFTKSAAKELGGLGIRVNAVSPGIIDTAMVQHYDESKRAELINATSLKRLGNPSDVAHVVAFLHSSHAGFIHGQNIGVDGGLVL